jgi:hypothetical protein
MKISFSTLKPKQPNKRSASPLFPRFVLVSPLQTGTLEIEIYLQLSSFTLVFIQAVIRSGYTNID